MLIKGRVSAPCKEPEEGGFAWLAGTALLAWGQKKDELMLLDKVDLHRDAPSGGGRPWHGPGG